MRLNRISSKRWFYPAVYFLLLLISILPPFTTIPYTPQNTQSVIQEILINATQPYNSWSWIFHLTTLALVLFIFYRPQESGRITAVYFGLNYLLIAALQSNAQTENYGFAIQTGALLATGLIGIIWLVVGWRGSFNPSFKKAPPWRWFLLPFALLVFWSPMAITGTAVTPNFDPRLLLTSPDYGLTYCFVTPVFLFLLILSYPQVDPFAYRVTAFNGLIYGIFNLTLWFNPDLVFMGVMHLPLLVMSIAALILPRMNWPENEQAKFQRA